MSTISPFEARRERSITALTRQTCRWKGVVRDVVILRGGASCDISAIVVAAGLIDTLRRSLSLKAICRHSTPPHHDPGARFAWTAASGEVTALAATTDAVTATAT